MTHVSVGEHLTAMVDQQPEPWMIELGQMLQELANIDNALAASRVYDLSRQPNTAQSLKELISGYAVLKKELENGSLTLIQEQTVKRAIQKISENLEELSHLSTMELSSKGVNHG
jgi:hypothetical protein